MFTFNTDEEFSRSIVLEPLTCLEGESATIACSKLKKSSFSKKMEEKLIH